MDGGTIVVCWDGMGLRVTAPRVSDAKDLKTIDTESLDSIRFVYFNLRKLYLHLNSVIIIFFFSN